MISGNITDFFLPRLKAAVTIPCSLAKVLDIPTALVSSALNLITLRRVEPIVRFNAKQADAVSSILPALFLNTLQIVNPNAEWEKNARSGYSLISNGITSVRVNRYFNKKVTSLQDNSVKFHIFGRCIYFIAIPTTIVCKIVDLVIGVCAGIAAFLALGTELELNLMAARGLKITSLITDIPLMVTKVLNAPIPTSIDLQVPIWDFTRWD